MDEELMYSTDENISETDDENILETDMGIEDVEHIVETEETIEVVEVELEEEINIEVDEAIGWVGGDSTRHYSLYGRDEADQHPITAITGLREELNDIEALDVVYSDKRNHADYYLWEDGNILQENRIGYFVSASSDINEIRLCTSDNDIFGVTVDGAGFIGAQSDIPRDIKYGLVVTTGVVHVRCESSVIVGDYVVSNDYGYAQTNTSGYKVAGRHKIDGIEYAEITLVTPIDKICELTDDVEELSNRMDAAETNIIAAMNVANEAYKKAEEANRISEDGSKTVNNLIDKSNEIFNGIDNAYVDIAKAKELSEEAKAIANAAVVSAEAIRSEAVETANKALNDVSVAINDLNKVIEEAHNDINNADAKAQLAVDNLRLLEEEMEPLAEWKDNEGNNSFAGFVARADEDSAILADMVTWQGTVEDGSIESIAGIDRRVSDNEATLNAVASYKKENDDGTITDGFAGLIAQVDENESELSLLSSYKYTDEDGNVISSGLSGLIQQVGANASSIKMLAGFEDDDVDSLGEIAIQVGENEAAIQSLVSWQTDVSKTVASTEHIAKENQASINSLTEVDTKLNNSITSIKQQSDENGASIELLAANVDKYSVGEYSQSYGLTLNQAKEILKNGTVYIPTSHGTPPSHSETFLGGETTHSFTPGAHYIWNSGKWIEYGNSVVFGKVEPAIQSNLKYWYIDSNTPPSGYEAHTLYEWNNTTKVWKKLNTLSGNVNNRATSMIKQAVDRISIDVVNTRGSVSALDLRLTETESEVQTVASWKKNVESDVANIATIKQTADDAGASVAQVAARVRGEYTSVDSWSVTGKNTNLVYYVKADKTYRYYKNGAWKSTQYPIEAGLEIDAASIVTAINGNGDTSVKLEGDHIILNGATTNGNGTFSISTSGHMTATGGTIGGWNINETNISKLAQATEDNKTVYYKTFLQAPTTVNIANNPALGIYYANADGTLNYDNPPPFRLMYDGALYATKANISGTITANSGAIGGWTINKNSGGDLVKNITSGSDTYSVQLRAHPGTTTSTAAFLVQKNGSNKFYVTYGGSLYASDANISGTLIAGTGSKIAGWNIYEGLLYKEINIPNTTNHYRVFMNAETGITSNGAAFGVYEQTEKNANIKQHFYVTYGGYLHATNAYIEGKIKATDGTFSGTITAGSGSTIGGWTMGIANNKNDNSVTQILSSVDGSCFLSPQGWTSTWTGNTTNEKYVCYFTPNFRVNKSGKLYATEADISGKITATSGKIGGWTIDGDKLKGTYTESIKVDPDGDGKYTTEKYERTVLIDPYFGIRLKSKMVKSDGTKMDMDDIEVSWYDLLSR